MACNEDDLHHLFSPYGTLLEVVIFRSKSGSEKGTSIFFIFAQTLSLEMHSRLHKITNLGPFEKLSFSFLL